MRESILSAIGSTPLVQLRRYLNRPDLHLYAKLEMMNPGGSIKDRPSAKIIEEAIAAGIIGPGSVIVESSSGNMGIGLAQACLYYGMRFICVVDAKTTRQNIQLLRTYGAEVDIVTQPDPATGELLQARINRVKTLLREIEGAFWPNQYENLNNPTSHYQATIHEIATALEGRIDVLFVATSTCGTIRGCAEYARDYGLGTRIVAVDALGSLIFSDKKAPRSIPGLGAGMRPPLCDLSLVDECVHVDDLDCVTGCRRLVAREAILAGGSSGGVVAAVEKASSRLDPGATCVAILPDRGERYLDTVYSDEWVSARWGEVEHLWNEKKGEMACVATVS
jgi:N-(2-amino-2-carboxyethyl)-L-glutamate synthase